MGEYKENKGSYDFLTSDNTALLLIDHQVGLMQLICDMSPEKFRNNLLGLCKNG